MSDAAASCDCWAFWAVLSNATVVTFSALAPSRVGLMPAAARMFGCQMVAMSPGWTTALSSSTDTERRFTVPGGVVESVWSLLTARLSLLVVFK